MSTLGSGPADARIMIVGNCYSDEDTRACAPFQGSAGMELSRMLKDAGIMRSECYLTNVVNSQPQGGRIDSLIAYRKADVTAQHTSLNGKYVLPPLVIGYNRLLKEIELVKPNVICSLDTVPTWLLTGAESITKWRGSHLTLSPPHEALREGGLLPKVIPTYPPAWVLAQWQLRPHTVEDLRRVKRESESRVYEHIPQWNFIVKPTRNEVVSCLEWLTAQLEAATEPFWLELDLETRAGHIACLGLSWSREDAICIPFMCVARYEGYWRQTDEAVILWHLHRVLTHRNVAVRWQNGLYDAQYIWRHWHFVPRGVQDTLISQHTAFVSLPKSLAFQSSMYSPHYVYWKDDGKTWEPNQPESKLWEYNCVDCVRTREVGEEELRIIKELNLQDVEAFQQKLFWPVLKAMQIGVRVDTVRKAQLRREIQTEIDSRKRFLATVLGNEINLASPPQMKDLFYRRLGQPPVMSRPKRGVVPHITCDDEALQTIAKREPLLTPIVNCIADIRTLQVLVSTFIEATVDVDGRMRSSFNIGGSDTGKSAPYTYRLSSSKNAFGGGCNFQNIPSDKSKSAGKALARGMTFKLPNMRGMYVPDPGYTMFDMDLDRADLQVVVWEADDTMLKAALRMGADIHLLNVYALDGRDPPPLEELVETHPKYPDHRGPRKHKREFSKVFCHACVAADHEVLTETGWRRIDSVSEKTPILVCSAGGEEAFYETPRAWWKGPCNTDLIHFEGQAVDQLVTLDHRMPYRVDKTGGMKVTQAQYLPGSARLPKSVKYSGKLRIEHPELLAAYQADGHLDTYGNVYFQFSKKRKIDRLKELLGDANYSVYDSEFSVRFYLPRDTAQSFGLQDKRMPLTCLQWDHETAVRYLTEQVLWDGHQGPTGAQWMSSVDRSRADLCHTLAHLHKFGSQRNTVKKTGKMLLHTWSLNNRTEWRLSSAVQRVIPGNGQMVYCPSTSTGFWLTRRNGKISVTGNTNYGGQARTVSAATGRSVQEIDRAQKAWFAAHPGIRRWHDRTLDQIQRFHFVENRFGYRWYIFDRLDRALPQALAWTPQSTVGCYINRIWVSIHDNVPDVTVLVQVHDSLMGQFPTTKREACLEAIQTHSRIVIPYEDPLIIPVGIKTSLTSWGDCQ